MVYQHGLCGKRWLPPFQVMPLPRQDETNAGSARSQGRSGMCVGKNLVHEPNPENL